MKTTRALAHGLILAFALGAAPALAGPTEDAKVFFDAGKIAYDKGDFVSAIAAFEPAYHLAPRTGILFSIAQAHRKQYFTGGKQVAHLQAAIAAYRDYLAKVPSGGRRSDAAEALAELEGIAAKMDPALMAASGPAVAAATVQVTRVVVNTQIADAQISLDGDKACEPPLMADVKPGKHTVRVSAPGYFDETRDVPVAAGQMVPVDVPLREKPGHLTVRARDGAQVSIDGRLAATTPLSQPLEVPPGRHLVSVTRNGYRAFGQEIEVGRDEARDLEVNLDPTVQRNASYGVIAAGVAGIAAGGVLAGLSIYHEQQAKSFESQQQGGALSCTNMAGCQTLYARYNDELNARNDFRTDAAITVGAGALVGVVGLMLYAFDQPTLSNAARRDDAAKPSAPAKERPMEMSAAPMLGPGLYGAALTGRF